MSLLRRVRAEVSGAVRSVRYDMGRRPAEPPADGPDVTSTGMNTFGGQLFLERQAPPATHRPPRKPRRALAVTAFGVLTVVGATGAYLGVVNGLGSLLNETPAAADTFPPQPAVTASYQPDSGIGRSPARAAAARPPVSTTAPGTTVAPALPADTPPVNGRRPNASPIRTVGPTSPECLCNFPPVPTPTAPSTPATTTPSTAPSDSPYPSDSASPSPSETSATPADSAEPSESPQARHRRRHH